MVLKIDDKDGTHDNDDAAAADDDHNEDDNDNTDDNVNTDENDNTDEDADAEMFERCDSRCSHSDYTMSFLALQQRRG